MAKIIITEDEFGESMEFVNEIACYASKLAKLLSKVAHSDTDYDFEERYPMRERDYRREDFMERGHMGRRGGRGRYDY